MKETNCTSYFYKMVFFSNDVLISKPMESFRGIQWKQQLHDDAGLKWPEVARQRKLLRVFENYTIVISNSIFVSCAHVLQNIESSAQPMCTVCAQVHAGACRRSASCWPACMQYFDNTPVWVQNFFSTLLLCNQQSVLEQIKSKWNQERGLLLSGWELYEIWPHLAISKDKVCLWSEAIYMQYGTLVQILWDNFSTDKLHVFYSKNITKTF